jgi:uncharacterized protein YcbX
MTSSAPVGHVIELRRYPVKSLLGEHRNALSIDYRGVIGDRLYAVCNEQGKFGSGKSTRRFRQMDGLFDLRASYQGERPYIAFPDGSMLAGDDPTLAARLSAHVGSPVTLAREDAIPHHDEGPIHLITTAALRAIGLEAREALRFRPNLVIAVPGVGMIEETWIGREIQCGEQVRLHVTGRAIRCVMIGMAQEDATADPHLLRRLGKFNDAYFGVYAEVIMPGIVNLGDEVGLGVI